MTDITQQRYLQNKGTPGLKTAKDVRACTIRLLSLEPAKYEKVAIYDSKSADFEYLQECGSSLLRNTRGT